jgi:hypothetical protein
MQSSGGWEEKMTAMLSSLSCLSDNAAATASATALIMLLPSVLLLLLQLKFKVSL